MRVASALLALALLCTTSWAHAADWSHRASPGDPSFAPASALATPLVAPTGSGLCAICLGLGQARAGLHSPPARRAAAPAAPVGRLQPCAPEPAPDTADPALPLTRAPPTSA